MTSEEKVLEELKEKIRELFSKITELKVAQTERDEFENEKKKYKLLIEDYKKHKQALLEREKCLKNF